MNKIRISLITFFAALLLAVCALFFSSAVVYADSGRTVTLTDKNVFYTPTGGANIAPVNVAEEGADSLYYTYFLFDENGQEITYRKNLAYSWYASDGEGNVGRGKFNLQLGFDSLGFERFTVKFQSQQYNKTKDNVTSNYLIFQPSGDGVKVVLSDDKDAVPEESCAVLVGKITVSFGEYSAGNYAVAVSDENGNSYSGTLGNVAETFAKYVSSGTTACMPLTFTAEFATDENGDKTDEAAAAGMVLYSLNGQSFQLYNVEQGSEGELSGDLIDDVAPVLCLNSNINYVTYGKEIDLGYTVIDVIASSPRSSVYFYVLTKSQYEDTEMNYDAYYTDDDDTGAYTKITTTTDIVIQRDSDTFIPSKYLKDNGEIDGVYGLVKIYIKVYDVSGSNGQSDYVFLDWYVGDEFKEDIYALKGNSDKHSYFLKVLEDEEGPAYGVTLSGTIAEEQLASYKTAVQAIRADYQNQIDNVIAALENDEGEEDDGILYAGSSSTLYFPAFRWANGSGDYIDDVYGGYTDLKYTIYYRSSSTGTSSALSYSQLALGISQAETYTFTIVATDAAGNSFRIPVINDDGEIEWQEIDTSLIWDEEYADLLPFFTVEAEYKRATAETPEEQTIGYVGTTYNNISFTINGISGTYKTAYRLFRFDRDAYYEETGVSLAYGEFVDLLNSTDDNGEAFFVTNRKYFIEIYGENELLEDDENYETNAAYKWNSSNVTFIPQSPEEFYAVELTVTDTGLNSGSKEYYMGIRASAQANALEGENYWLENNLTSIILLCVAGASFIALIIVLVIKPKDKGDVDVIDLDAENKKKKKKAKAKAKDVAAE